MREWLADLPRMHRVSCAKIKSCAPHTVGTRLQPRRQRAQPAAHDATSPDTRGVGGGAVDAEPGKRASKPVP